MNSNEQSPWHAGERHLQEVVGVAERMAMIGPKVIRDHLPEQHRDFYPLLPYLVLGVVDDQGTPWATMVEGAPGFAHSPNPYTLQIDSLPSTRDPARAAFRQGAAVGLLGIDLNTRRRNRMNGRVGALDHEGFSVDVVHTYGNCPKYIQLRPVDGIARKPGNVAAVDSVGPGRRRTGHGLHDLHPAPERYHPRGACLAGKNSKALTPV